MSMRVKAAVFITFCIVALAVLSSCANMGKGPISEPIVGVGAALLAAIDQLFASGMLTPEQHAVLHGGIRDISIGVAQAAQGVQNMTRRVDALDSGTVSPETVGGLSGGVLLAGAAIQRWLRGPAATPEEKADRAAARAAKAKRRAAA